MSSEMSEVATKSAAEIGRMIGAGTLDPVALTEHYLAAAVAKAKVYVRLTHSRALREAEAARERARAGLRRGPLDGVPISWKDLFDMAGKPTQAGSRLLADAPPAERDAPVVARAARAGIVALGKTHLSEFAFSGLGFNPMTETPPNFYDPERAPGGSSSGAAASVAFGLAAAGIGSDTGGSVRIPSAWNGLVGLKTTAGLIPLDGVAPLAPSLDTVGPLTRTVEDAALLYAVLAERPAPDLAGASAKGLALLVPETVMLDNLDPGVAEAFEAALERLGRAGARITRGPIPEFAETVAEISTNGFIVNTEGYAVWKQTIEANPDGIYVNILSRFRSGGEVTGDQAEHVKLTLARLQRSYLARTARYDAVIAPTTPGVPPRVAEIDADPAVYARENIRALSNTRIGNYLGLSGLALPNGVTRDGMPSSLMLLGAPFAEARLLRAGEGVMRALS